MTAYVALLRGINVGGARKVPMKRLTPLFEAAGHTEVEAYIQSGNVVFASAKAGDDALARDLERRIEAEFGFPVEMVVRSHAEMKSIVKNNPYRAEAAADGTKVSVNFLPAVPAKALVAAAELDKYLPERALVAGRDVYYHLPNGTGRAKLPNYVTRALKSEGTVRNWKTVLKLCDMMGAIK